MSGSCGMKFKMGELTDLTGKVALVTGGGTGIGLMIAKGLASSGAKVYIGGRRLEALQKASEFQFDGEGALVVVQMDVTDKASILSVVEKIKNAHGKLDVLVNNAATDGPNARGNFMGDSDSPEADQSIGAYGQMLFDIQSFEQWESLARTNLASVFFVTTAFLALLEASTHGREGATASVINITSNTAHMNISFGFIAYTSLKAGTRHLTQLLATELSLKRAPIRVNAIAPGIFPSELSGTPEQLKEYTKTPMAALQPIPARRAGREEEMAALAVYLASPASSYTHGQEIMIDGRLEGVNP
ncbi:hypothetical protein M0805_006705 [Coniferiporia weirii]|nr:hypothetical protein M0805_006705 [Coniferiporia weirii]